MYVTSSSHLYLFYRSTLSWEYNIWMGHAVAYLVEALSYKPEGRGLDSRCHWILQLTWSFQPHYDPGVDSASIEMSTKDLSGGKGQPARKAHKFITIC
jgi:hypothetical protein